MTLAQWRNFAPNQKLPATWTDGIEKLLSNYASPNLVIDQPTATSLRVKASTGADARVLAIAGSPRWIEADVSVMHPGGGAGSFDLWAVTTADSFGTDAGPPVSETDTTTRSFTLKIGAPSGSGGEALSRKLATGTWDGSAITAWTPLIDPIPTDSVGAAQIQAGAVGAAELAAGAVGAAAVDAAVALPPVAAIMAYAGTVLPTNGKWAWADGALIDRTTYAAFFALVGHAYNGGVDPGGNQVRLPDLRERVPAGAGPPGTLGGRMVASMHQNFVGGEGGEGAHSLIAAEGPSHQHWLNGFHYPAPYAASVSGTIINYQAGASALNVFTYSGGQGVSDRTELTGSGSPHENFPPYQVVNYLVRIA